MTPGNGRSRNYRDAESMLNGDVDLDDPLERAAIAVHVLKAATPDDVAALFTRGRGELAERWRVLEPADRQLARRRADVIVRVAHAGKDL
jgi:hypothetical protein